MINETFLICLKMRSELKQRISLFFAECNHVMQTHGDNWYQAALEEMWKKKSTPYSCRGYVYVFSLYIK